MILHKCLYVNSVLSATISFAAYSYADNSFFTGGQQYPYAPILIAGVSCTGNESKFLSCNINDNEFLASNCYYVGGVKCEGNGFTHILIHVVKMCNNYEHDCLMMLSGEESYIHVYQ